MGKLFNQIDQFMEKTRIITTNFFAWFFWFAFLFSSFVGISEQGFSEYIGTSSGEISFFLVLTSIWIWGTVRWLKKRGYISKISRKPVSKITFSKLLIVNIIAPIIVSLVVHSITGSSSITIFSIPILSYLSANLEIG